MRCVAAAESPSSVSGEALSWAGGGGISYVAFETLSEAKADPEGVVILEGDYGGQIYVVVQAEQVLCSQKTLSWLLHDLDRISWPGSYDDSARIVFERSRPAPRWQGEWVAASQHATPGFTPNWFGWDSTTRSARFCAARLTASRRSVEQSDGLDGLHCAGKQKSAGSHVSAVVSLANCQHARTTSPHRDRRPRSACSPDSGPRRLAGRSCLSEGARS